MPTWIVVWMSIAVTLNLVATIWRERQLSRHRKEDIALRIDVAALLEKAE